MKAEGVECDGVSGLERNAQCVRHVFRAGKEVAGADFFVGIDAGAELKPQLIPVLNGVLGVGGGLAVVSFDQIEGYGRLTAGVEFVPTSSAVALRGVLHTGIPPFPKHGAIGVMLFVGLEYRFPRKL